MTKSLLGEFVLFFSSWFGERSLELAENKVKPGTNTEKHTYTPGV